MAAVLLTIAFITLVYVFYKIYPNILKIVHIQKMPGPEKSNIFFGNMHPLHDTPANIFKVMRNWGLQYYPIYKLWISHLSVANVLNADDLEVILNGMEHIKKGISYNLLHRWLGSGLLTSTGSKWQARRKILTPSFHFSILQTYVGIFQEETEKIVEMLKRDEGSSNKKIAPIITEFTLKTIGRTSMGVNFDFKTEKEQTYRQSFHDLLQIHLHRLFRPWVFYDCFYIFHPMFYRELKLIKNLHNFTKSVISERQNTFQPQEDTTNRRKRPLALLDLLITEKNQHGTIDDEGLREEIDTFMFEGHDTTQSAISFALLMIACHKEVQDNIIQEMKEVLGDLKKPPSYNDLQELKYMERVVKEVLRLYPPVHYISRESGEDFVTPTGFTIKKGTLIQIHIYDLHHNPNVFEDPEKFDPDRFLPENAKNRSPFAYLPFSAGPRNCIGQKFALLEIKTFLCGLLSNYVLEPVDTPETIVLVVDIVLRTKNDIRVKFVERKM